MESPKKYGKLSSMTANLQVSKNPLSLSSKPPHKDMVWEFAARGSLDGAEFACGIDIVVSNKFETQE